MKTTIIFLFIFVISISTVNAQNGFGFKAGVNLPNVSMKSKYSNFRIEPKDKIGFNAGIFLDVGSIESFTIISGLSYTRKMISGNYGFVNPGTKNEANMSVDYLIYTLSGKYNFLRSGSRVNPYATFAPRLNFYLSNDYTEESVSVPQSVRNIISDNLTRFGFGVSFGAGVDFKTESIMSPFVEVQFSPDFFNAYDDGFVSFKSNSIELMAGVRIGK